MNLAAIDPGAGFPALLDWDDIDSASRTATTGAAWPASPGPMVADFDIARQGGSSAKWNL